MYRKLNLLLYFRSMIYGYARVSTKDQNLDLQMAALKNAGCELIFSEKISSGKSIRKELDSLLAKVSSGDTIVIWKLDRLGRSLHELIKIVKDLEQKRIQLISIIDNIATETMQGRLFLQIVAVFAEYERAMVRERTIAGINAAKAKGRNGGRPKGISEEYQVKASLALTLRNQRNKSIKEICEIVGMSRSTYYRIVMLYERKKWKN